MAGIDADNHESIALHRDLGFVEVARMPEVGRKVRPVARSRPDAADRPIIVWDLGGVVASFDHRARLAALAQATGLPSDRIEQDIWQSGLDAAAEQGLLDEQQVWSRVLDILEHTIGCAELRRCWALAFVPDPEVLAVIDRIGPPAVLLTDNGPILEACLRNELRLLADRFDPILLSWRLQATKRHPLAFERAAQALNIEPSDLTLIDDRPTNIRAALTAGWHAIQYETADAIEQALKPTNSEPPRPRFR